MGDLFASFNQCCSHNGRLTHRMNLRPALGQHSTRSRDKPGIDEHRRSCLLNIFIVYVFDACMQI